MRKAAVYCRVSTDLQASKGHSLDWQRANLPKLAQAAGAIVDDGDVFVEVMSGAKDDRPEYNRLMAAIVDGYYAEVWVVETSRLSRTEDRGEVQRVVDALQRFGCVIRTPGATFDLSTIEGEFIYDVDSAVNRMERKRIKARMANGKATKVSKGGYCGGNPPTGYAWGGRDADSGKMTFVIDEPMADMVRLAYYLATSGQSANSIARELSGKGVAGPNGGKITAATIIDWLRNPHYAGYTQRGHGRGSKAAKVVVEENAFLPIITKAEFQAVQKILDRRTIIRDKRMTHPLSGILKCGNCGLGMKADSAHGKRVYVCPSKANGNSCKGDSPKFVYQHIAHQMLIDFLPGFIRYVETKAPLKQAKPIPGKQKPLEALEKKKQDVYKRIMSNIRQQEDTYSAIRKNRIIELETKFNQIEHEIKEASKAKNVVELPRMAKLSELISELKPDDSEQLKQIACSCFDRLYFMKRGRFHDGKFEITRIVTAWGDECRVSDNRLVFFEGKR